MSCLLSFAAQSRMVIFHNLQILKQTQAAMGEQRPDSDPRQPRQRRGPLAPLAAPHQSHIHLFLRRLGARPCTADGFVVSPGGTHHKPFQTEACSVPPFLKPVASENTFQSSNYFFLSWDKKVSSRQPQHTPAIQSAAVPCCLRQALPCPICSQCAAVSHTHFAAECSLSSHALLTLSRVQRCFWFFTSQTRVNLSNRL